MKKLFICFWLLLGIQMLIAQTPQFEFKLYGQDALGNRDSVTIAYDTRARRQYLDTIFGEVETRQPFNNIFEMRVLVIDSLFRQRISKKSVVRYSGNCSPTGGSEYVKLVYKVRNLPVTLSWDSTLFQPRNPNLPQRCYGTSILFASERIYAADCVRPNYMPTRLSQTSSFIEYFDPVRANICYDQFIVDNRNIGGIVDTLQNNTILFNSNGLTSIETPPMEEEISVFPNPCIEKLTLQLEIPVSVSQIQIFNVLGALLKSENYSDSYDQLNVDVSNLQSGIYIAVIQSKDGKIWRTKFVKQQ
jgi:hypothetical protein